MEQPRPSRPDRIPRSQYHNPPPVTVLRSQYASNVRSSSHQPDPAVSGPRYFSSPLRAPLHRQDRQNSLADHQRSTTHPQDDDSSLPEPQFPQEPERTSYSFFEPHAAVRPLRINKKANPTPFDNEHSDYGSESSLDRPTVVRQASIGHKAKPALTNVKRSDSTQTKQTYTNPHTPQRRTTADSEILNDATAITPSRPNRIHPLPESPTSMYSQDLQNNHKVRSKSNTTFSNAIRESVPLETLHTPVRVEAERSSSFSGPTLHSERSASSNNPLLGLGIDHQGMSKRVPEEMRPPKLNMKVVEELEARGSITSLPDLIRRATRLAANLDRGKTASRLGMLDMFGNFDHGPAKRRESTYTDMLEAFPDPSSSTPSKAPRPTTMWPGDKSQVMVSEKQSSGSKKKRRCCGLSVTAFVVLLIVVILLIAAAVLIPIFLVAVPRQNQNQSAVTNLRTCPSTHTCRNNGISLVDNNACSCICIDGFTGSDCSLSADPNCVTANLADESHTYDNATVGSSIVSLVQQSGSQMNIPINASVLLSIFADQNFSCASENSLVQFDLSKKQRGRRLFIVPGLGPNEQSVPNLPVPSRTVQQAPDSLGNEDAARETVFRRLNDDSYQTSSSLPTATTSDVGDSVATATMTSSTFSSTATTNITSSQVEFAQLVVLYVLTDTRAPSAAVLAQQKIQQYFRAGALQSGNSTVNVVDSGNGPITVNFERLDLTLSSGKIIGGG